MRDAQGRYLDAEDLRRRQKRGKTSDLRVEPRKVSASSLGSYLFPQPQEPIDEADLDLVRAGSTARITPGQYEVWRAIVSHAVQGDTSQAWLNDLPHFEKTPARKQVTLSTVETARSFDAVNKGKPYRERIKPFNFVLELPQLTSKFARECVVRGDLPPNKDGSTPRLGPFYAPYTTNPDDLGEWRENEWGERTFWATKGNVRYTRDDDDAGVKAGDPYTGPLMTLADVLTTYAHHPESKFGNGRASDHGRVRHRQLLAWGYRYHGKESQGFDPEVSAWESEPEAVDYESLLDGQEATVGSRYEDDPGRSERPTTTLQDALRAIPRAWLAKQWGKSESEIKRIRNNHVHLSSKLRDEATYLIRRYRHEQEMKAERDYKADLLGEQEREGRQGAKEALATIRAMGRISQPGQTSTESDLAYARVLSDYHRRVPTSLRNAQGGGLPLDAMCAVLVEHGIYHGQPDDLDAFGDWLHDLVATRRKAIVLGVKGLAWATSGCAAGAGH